MRERKEQGKSETEGKSLKDAGLYRYLGTLLT